MIACREFDNKGAERYFYTYIMRHGALGRKWGKRVCANTYVHTCAYTHALLVHFLPDALGVLAAVSIWQLSCAVWVFIILL